MRSWSKRIVSAALLITTLAACGGGERTATGGAGGSEQAATGAVASPTAWWSIHPRPRWTGARLVARDVLDWFDVYEVAPSTFALYEPRQFQEAISYLVLGEERAALIDAGMGIADMRAAVRTLTDLPVVVLLTHEHFDHYGGASGFEELWTSPHPGVRVRLAEGRNASSLRGQVAPEEIWRGLPDAFDPGAYSIPPLAPTKLLEDGEIVDLGRRRLEVIATPGHSPGSLTFLDPDRRLLFTGDHFYPGPLYAHGADADVDWYLASNDRLAARVAEYDLVMGGHNEPLVRTEVIPRVSEAFRTILAGRGEFQEAEGVRRYAFDGFDVMIRAETVRGR